MVEEGKIQSSYPSPPKCYFSQFTDEAVERGDAPAPPAIPPSSYSCFGVPLEVDEEILRPLSSQGIQQVYSSSNPDRISEMRKLNFSILVNFLDLLSILVHSPNSPKREEKVNDISLLFINMHHLINEYRPHQARETIRVMMEAQRTRRLAAISDVDSDLKKVQQTLARCAPILTGLQAATTSAGKSTRADCESSQAKRGEVEAGGSQQQSGAASAEEAMDTGAGGSFSASDATATTALEPRAKMATTDGKPDDRRHQCSDAVLKLCDFADTIT